MESNGEKENVVEALKRRSSILKTRDETKVQNPTTNFTRRISFHNVLKVQQYNKDNGDLCREQEEQLHMTGNSDNFRTEVFSTSFVAGPSVNNIYDPSLTFLNSPQANSTPAVSAHGRSRKSKSTKTSEDTTNMTMNVFANIHGNRCVEIFSETTDVSDKTYVVFEPPKARSTEENTQVMGAATHMEDETQNIFDMLKAGASRPLMAMNDLPPVVVEDDDGETKALFAQLQANKILNESEKVSNKLEQNKPESVNLPMESERILEPMDDEPVFNDADYVHEDNQHYVSDQEINTSVHQNYNHESQLPVDEQKHHVSDKQLPLSEDQWNRVSQQQFSENTSLIGVNVIEESRWSNRFYNSGGTSVSMSISSMSGLPTPQLHHDVVKPSEDAPVYNCSMFTGVTEDMMAQAALLDDNSFNFGESMLEQMPTATNPLMRSRSRRLLGDTRVTAVNVSALQEPSEVNDILFHHTAEAIAHGSSDEDAKESTFDMFAGMEAASDKNSTLFDEFDKNATYSVDDGLAFDKNNTFSLSPKKTRTFHKRRRSSVFVSASGGNSNSAVASPATQFIAKPSSILVGIIERRKSLLKQESDVIGSAVASPTIVVATEDSFNDIVIEVSDSEMALARELHSRKQAIYKLMETTFDHMEALRSEGARVDVELKSAFAELLTKISD